jgi:para-aminobenzoate synthetase component 1
VYKRQEIYRKAFSNVQKHLHNGDTYLLNLTFATEITTGATLKDIFESAAAKYKLLFRDEFVCFSPETFVKIKDNRIYSFPMKGTIDASIPDAENIILNDFKETAEHNTIVDLIRNDLSIVAKEVRLVKYRYIDKITTNNKDLLQVSSEISGKLPDNWNENIGTIIFELLPAGSISGAPKKRTVEIIKETENYERGYYTGIFGVYDGEGLDSAVAIRFIERNKGKFYYKSGGGITVNSDMVSEYNELQDKIYVPVN